MKRADRSGASNLSGKTVPGKEFETLSLSARFIWEQMLTDADANKAIESLSKAGCDLRTEVLWVDIASTPLLCKAENNASPPNKLPGVCPNHSRKQLPTIDVLTGYGIKWRLYFCPLCKHKEESVELILQPRLRRAPDRNILAFAKKLGSLANLLEEPSLLHMVFLAEGDAGLRVPRGFSRFPVRLREVSDFLDRLAVAPTHREVSYTDEIVLTANVIKRLTGRPHYTELSHLLNVAFRTAGLKFLSENDYLKVLVQRKAVAREKVEHALRSQRREM